MPAPSEMKRLALEAEKEKERRPMERLAVSTKGDVAWGLGSAVASSPIRELQMGLEDGGHRCPPNMPPRLASALSCRRDDEKRHAGKTGSK